MPELRSGARQARLKSKKLDDIPPASQPFEQAENWLPTPNRTGRRTGAGRGRGANAATVAKGPAATPVRPTVAGRGKGIRVIDLDPDQPCEALPGAAAGGIQDFFLNQAAEVAADKDLVMEGGSAEKLVGAEDEPTTTPVPERVTFPCCLYFDILELSFVPF